MAQYVYQGYFDDIVGGNAGAVDLRVLLVMSNSTFDTDTNVANLSDITTLDECDGAGYARLDLQTVTAAWDGTNMRLEYDAADGDMDGGSGIITASTRQVTGFIVYRYVDGTAANDVPWFGRDIGPYSLAGGAFDFQWNAEGFLQVASA
jgi:hypothetical protein